MPTKVLITNPMAFTLPSPALFFGVCVVGRAHLTYCYVGNTGDSDLTITALTPTSGAKFKIAPLLGVLPLVIPARKASTLIATFSPVAGDEDVLLSDTITITHNGDNGPTFAFAISGWGVATGRPELSLSPFALSFNWVDGRDYFAGITIGERSMIHIVQLINSGDRVLEVASITARWPTKLVEPVPRFPVVLSSGAALNLYLTLYPSIVGSTIYNNSLDIISSSSHEPLRSYVTQVTGLAVTSAHILAGTSRVALAALGAAGVIKQFNPASLVPEELASFSKTFDLTLPHLEKFLAKFRARYEDLGVASFDLTVRTRDAAGTPQTIAIGTGAADSFIREALADVQLSEQIFKVTVAWKTGQLSFVDFGFDFEPEGEVID